MVRKEISRPSRNDWISESSTMVRRANSAARKAALAASSSSMLTSDARSVAGVTKVVRVQIQLGELTLQPDALLRIAADIEVWPESLGHSARRVSRAERRCGSVGPSLRTEGGRRRGRRRRGWRSRGPTQDLAGKRRVVLGSVRRVEHAEHVADCLAVTRHGLAAVHDGEVVVRQVGQQP